MNCLLPKKIAKTGVPPIKCQGIKTRLVPFIAGSVAWDGSGNWVEPFLGSGVVLFNVAPDRARVSDTNPHIIKFYRDLQSGKLRPENLRDYLTDSASRLEAGGQSYYNFVRDRFNKEGDSRDFIFLNRSCFNGLMRFNSKGGFNVPFGHKTERFRQAYITKIMNKVKWVLAVMRGKN